MAQVGNSRLFSLQYPEHPLMIEMRSMVAQIVSE
jgi:hypothetical protein